MSDPKLTQHCAGGCGATRELSSFEFRMYARLNIGWWCEGCDDQAQGELILKLILAALEKQPHLRAKLREILEMDTADRVMQCAKEEAKP